MLLAEERREEAAAEADLLAWALTAPLEAEPEPIAPEPVDDGLDHYDRAELQWAEWERLAK